MDLKDYDIAEHTIHYIQINDMIKKRNTKSTEAEENFQKAEFFMIDLKTDTQNFGWSEKFTTKNMCPK